MPSLMIQEVIVEDIPALSQLWYTAFSIPVNLRMFPDTPAIREWWDKANRHDLLHNTYRKYFKIVDLGKSDVLVAYAKWDLDPSVSGEKFPLWHEESDQEACEHLFTVGSENRKAFFGDRKHYYLDMLVVHPEYRRQGAASMLIQWGCDLADKNSMPAYIDAHEDAAPLYRKFGFKDRTDLGVSSEGAIAMIREPQC
ncbi:hypothetical protein N7456_005927 [Penicillium angulare]|uniref:N-acetyltransferase domain-containing protein n=1 Tax=Penicillium angulare TaxID=116970 RepID=A0A9W9G104_9EURO|nr:hypothetical protein N7456_005927 [Penicillium angulare]